MSSIHNNSLQSNSNAFRLWLEIIFLSSSLQSIFPIIRDKGQTTTNEHDRRLLEDVHRFIMGLQGHIEVIQHECVSDLVRIFQPDLVKLPVLTVELQQNLLKLTKKLLMLALFLGLALRGADSDYSMLYSVSDWAMRLLTLSHSAMGGFRDVVQTLNDTVRLTSGWELTNVWEFLYKQKWTSEACNIQRCIECLQFDSCTSSEIQNLSGKSALNFF